MIEAKIERALDTLSRLEEQWQRAEPALLREVLSAMVCREYPSIIARSADISIARSLTLYAADLAVSIAASNASEREVEASQ